MADTTTDAATAHPEKQTEEGPVITRLMKELQFLMNEVDALDGTLDDEVKSRIEAVENNYRDRSERLEQRHNSGIGRMERLFLGQKRQNIAVRYLSEERDAEIAKVTRIHSMFEVSHHQKLQARVQTVFNQWITAGQASKSQVPKIETMRGPKNTGFKSL